jgi:8-oxo-dGTP pyrophosphatase MutT (NUDIX family)
MGAKETCMKIASIVWTIDPNGEKRFLIRHNRPFDGYDDEWTILFGNVDEGEKSKLAAIREVGEEYGIFDISSVNNLDYSLEYKDKDRATVIHFFSMRVESIDIPIQLNNESIGYDWMTLEKAIASMRYDDESIALTKVG